MRFLSRTPGTRCRTIRLGRSFVSGGSGSREGSRRSIYGLTTETDTSTLRNAALTTTQVGAEGLCDYKKPRAAVKTASSSILFGTASGMRDFPEGFERLRRVHLSIGKEFGVPIVDASYANLKYLGDKATTERIESISHADKGHPGLWGSYINSCGIYSVVTGRSPMGLVAPADMPKDVVKALQTAAWSHHLETSAALKK